MSEQTALGPVPEPWLFVGNVVKVSVEANITREQVHETIDRIFRLSGCTGCGLLGFDVHLLGGGDPAPIAQLRGVQGVQNVELVNRSIARQEG